MKNGKHHIIKRSRRVTIERETERDRQRQRQTDRQTETERQRNRETETEKSNSRTLFYKDCSLGSVKNLTTSPF